MNNSNFTEVKQKAKEIIKKNKEMQEEVLKTKKIDFQKELDHLSQFFKKESPIWPVESVLALKVFVLHKTYSPPTS